MGGKEDRVWVGGGVRDGIEISKAVDGRSGGTRW